MVKRVDLNEPLARSLARALEKPPQTRPPGAVAFIKAEDIQWFDEDGYLKTMADTEASLIQAKSDLAAGVADIDKLKSDLTAADARITDMATKADDAWSKADSVFGMADQATRDAQDAWNKSVETADALQNIAAIVKIDSSRGVLFKSNQIATTLTVTVYRGDFMIDNIVDLQAQYGPGAYIEWQWRREADADFGVISSADRRLSLGGFALTVSPADVDSKTVFRAVVNSTN